MGHAEDGDADAEPKLLGECEDGTEAPISAPAGESFQLKKIFFFATFSSLRPLNATGRQ